MPTQCRLGLFARLAVEVKLSKGRLHGVGEVRQGREAN